ncbi:MAG: ring,2-phenylacetyl-CoA epoxidase subunit PaaA, partial [Streptomyces sp.]|nr:ring,2-phenylacetyl-CoA epoxidase subunit PaaA [Streptomyces sp.]
QREMAQDAVNRWWLPAVALMFGPPDTVAGGADARTAALGAAVSRRAIAWGIKRHTNDELRQRFVDHCVPQAERLGLGLPDPNIRWNEERRHYDFGPIDWEVYRSALGDDSHCARRRLSHRVAAHEDGAWVREAAAAYAAREDSDADLAERSAGDGPTDPSRAGQPPAGAHTGTGLAKQPAADGHLATDLADQSTAVARTDTDRAEQPTPRAPQAARTTESVV